MKLGKVIWPGWFLRNYWTLNKMIFALTFPSCFWSSLHFFSYFLCFGCTKLTGAVGLKEKSFHIFFFLWNLYVQDECVVKVLFHRWQEIKRIVTPVDQSFGLVFGRKRKFLSPILSIQLLHTLKVFARMRFSNILCTSF